MTSGVTAVLSILEDALALLTDEVSGCAISPGVCRVTLDPGNNTAWDTCGDNTCSSGDGQLWANITTLTASPQQGPCQTITWAATIGVVRCAATVRDDGTPPSSDAVQADAWQQALDADTIWSALTCCDTRPESLRDVAVVAWVALGPTGGCVGGQWTVRGQLDVCC